MVTRATTPNRSRAIIDQSGKMTQEFTNWTQIVTNQLVIFGTGNPEGVIEAPAGAVFIDQTVSVTPYEYRKQLDEISGDRAKGWRS